jgi:glyoxylase I family protein
MNIGIAGLDHIVLRIQSLDASLDFYCGILGCHEERRVAELGLVQLRAGTALIDLIEVGSPLGKLGGAGPGDEGRNVDHFALWLPDFDEPALRAHLELHGVESGSVEPRYGAQGIGPSMYIRDPDSNVVELKGPGCG